MCIIMVVKLVRVATHYVKHIGCIFANANVVVTVYV
jgi:hypothetical protein